MDEVQLITKLRNGTKDVLNYMAKKIYPSLDDAVMEYTGDLVQKEMKRYAAKKDNILRESEGTQMKSFSLEVLYYVYILFFCNIFCNCIILYLYYLYYVQIIKLNHAP